MAKRNWSSTEGDCFVGTVPDHFRAGRDPPGVKKGGGTWAETPIEDVSGQ